MNSENFNRYMETYNGKNLVSSHSLDETGVWEILGEDPNADLGGRHIMPTLGNAKGKLKDVIEYAVDIQGFWTYGYGGKIRKIVIVDVSEAANKKRKAILEEMQSIDFRLQALRKELENINEQ